MCEEVPFTMFLARRFFPRCGCILLAPGGGFGPLQGAGPDPPPTPLPSHLAPWPRPQKGLAVVPFVFGLGLQYNARTKPSNVTISNLQLFVDGEPYVVRGVAFSPIPKPAEAFAVEGRGFRWPHLPETGSCFRIRSSFFCSKPEEKC